MEAYYTEHPFPAVVAIEDELPPAARAAREIEAEGYYRKRPPKGGRRFCFAPRHDYDFDPTAINAIRCIVDDVKPSWVAEVKAAARMSNDPRWIAAWCEMSPNVVIAILRNLTDRDEIEISD